MASDVPSRFLVERMDVFTKVFLPGGIKPKKLTKGDRDQAFREPQRLRWERTSPNHRTVILTGASHHIEEDAPDEIVAAIRDWWPGTSKHRAACGITWCTTGVRLTIPSTVRNVHLDGRAGIDAALVRRLIATQFPQWRDLPVTPVASTDGTTAPTGSARSCRFDYQQRRTTHPRSRRKTAGCRSWPHRCRLPCRYPWRLDDRARATHFVGQFGPGSMAEPH